MHVIAGEPDVTFAFTDPMAVKTALGSLVAAGYDRIVIDGSPLSEGADVVLLEEAADGVILVARTGHTTVRDLRQAQALLDPTRFLGVVLVDA